MFAAVQNSHGKCFTQFVKRKKVKLTRSFFRFSLVSSISSSSKRASVSCKYAASFTATFFTCVYLNRSCENEQALNFPNILVNLCLNKAQQTFFAASTLRIARTFKRLRNYLWDAWTTNVMKTDSWFALVFVTHDTHQLFQQTQAAFNNTGSWTERRVFWKDERVPNNHLKNNIGN